MKKKIVKCLLSLTGLATVLISWGAPTQAAVLGDDYPSSWKYGGFGVDPGLCTGVSVRPLRPIASATPMDSPYQ